MKKRIVGIHASYNASEQTLCAEFLAGYIAKCYRFVKWFVPEIPERARGFSHQWDTEVVPCYGSGEKAKRTAAQCDTFFFFRPQDDLFDALPRHAVTAFVVDPRNRTPETVAFGRRCTFTLLPSEQWLDRKNADHRRHILVWPCDPSVQCIPRIDLDYEKEPRLFFPAFGLSYLDRHFILQVADIVKRCKPNVKTVVGYYDANVIPTAGNDSRTHDWRLIRYLQNSDWVIDLNPKPLYGLFAACAGGYGLQWVGFDTVPNNDEWNASRRHLISQPIGRPGNQERVLPDLESTATQIVALLDTPFPSVDQRHRSCGVWDHRRAEYLRVTNIVLGVKTKY